MQLITATHSPLILASAEPVFDPEKDAWFDLDLEKEEGAPTVKLRRRTFVRRGDVSNWLTSEAFDLKCARSLEAEAAIEQARALLRRTTLPTLEEARRWTRRSIRPPCPTSTRSGCVGASSWKISGERNDPRNASA